MTQRNTKVELLSYLKDVVGLKILPKTLTDRVDYTVKGADKDLKQVPKTTLWELVQDVMSSIVEGQQTVVPMEASAKPVLKKPEAKVAKAKVAKAEPKVEAEPEEEAPVVEAKVEEKKPTTKKSKSIGKLKTPKAKKEEAKVEEAPGLTIADLPMATIFPKEIEHEALGKMIARFEEFTDFKSLREAIEAGRNLVFATYWTKRHLKEFHYAEAKDVPVPKKGFPYNLDTLQAVYVCEGVDKLYMISTYTEAWFALPDGDLGYTECEAPDGSKFKMRYTHGLEYEIYELA